LCDLIITRPWVVHQSALSWAPEEYSYLQHCAIIRLASVIQQSDMHPARRPHLSQGLESANIG